MSKQKRVADKIAKDANIRSHYSIPYRGLADHSVGIPLGFTGGFFKVFTPSVCLGIPSFIRSKLAVFVISIKFMSSFESEANLEPLVYSESHFKGKKITYGKQDDIEGTSNRKPCNSYTQRCGTYTFTHEEENQKIQIRLIYTSGIGETPMDFLEMNRI